MIRHPLMVQDHIRHLPALQHRNEGIINEMQQDDVHRRIRAQGMAHDTLHAQNLLPGPETIGMVIDGRLDKQQVRQSLRQDIRLETECMRVEPREDMPASMK